MKDYVGAILAAGRGSRMGTMCEAYPKPLLPVANRPLIVHHVQVLRDLGIEEVYVVIGHKAKQIVKVLGDGQDYGVRITYFDQGVSLGSAHAVAQLASNINSPFVLLLGDYYFSAPKLSQMFEHANSNKITIIAAKREPDRLSLCEACVLEMDGDRRVKRIIEKPKAPLSDIKGCGIYVCRPEVMDAVCRTPRTALRNEYELTVSLDICLQMGHPIYADEVIEWDMNFTRPDDVLQCNLEWLDRHGYNQLVGDNVQLPNDSKLERTIIGDNVTIEEHCSLRNVVIFEGTHMQGGVKIEDALVTPTHVIHRNGACKLNQS